LEHRNPDRSIVVASGSCDESTTTSAFPASGAGVRRPIAQQHGLEARVVLGCRLVIRVEDAVAIEEYVHRLGYAEHHFEAVRPSRASVPRSIACITAASDPRSSHFSSLYRVLPAEIPDAHPVFTETPNVMRVESAFGSPVEDRIGVQKHPARGKEVIIAAHLTGRYHRAAEVVPLPLHARQNEPPLLHPRVAVDDDEEPRPVCRQATCGDNGGGPGDPFLLPPGRSTIFLGERTTQLRDLAGEIDRRHQLRRGGD
jgi:hypothetical protein